MVLEIDYSLYYYQFMEYISHINYTILSFMNIHFYQQLILFWHYIQICIRIPTNLETNN